MKAVVYTSYGPPEVLQLQEVEKPVPGDNQVLVKVQASSINALEYRRFESQSLFGRLMDTMLTNTVNKVLGADVAGKIEAVGAAVTKFKPGDEVYGFSAGGGGAFAEYTCASEKNIALKPATLSFEAAAAIPVAALTALQGLRDKGQIQRGQKVLIVGASGGVGSFAVQIARSFGAEVTAVCSTRNLQMVRDLGAVHSIDYTRENFSRNGQHYDLIIGVNGYYPLQAYWRALKPGGTYMAVGGSIAQVLQAILLGPLLSRIGSKKLGFMGISKPSHEDLLFMNELVEAGKVVPVIDRCYSLSETVKAVYYLVEEHAQGKVIINVEQEELKQ